MQRSVNMSTSIYGKESSIKEKISLNSDFFLNSTVSQKIMQQHLQNLQYSCVTEIVAHIQRK